jgi:hypothetical protein
MTDAPAMAGSGTRSSAAFYADSLDAFLRASDDEVYAPLTSPHGYTLAPEQLSAWRLQLPILRAVLAEVVPRLAADPAAPAPWLHLEFDIPRLGRRVDAVLVTHTAVLPIEFKVGAKKFQQTDYEQAWDYGLDHEFGMSTSRHGCGKRGVEIGWERMLEPPRDCHRLLGLVPHIGRRTEKPE